jgi:HSP20 family protein
MNFFQYIITGLFLTFGLVLYGMSPAVAAGKSGDDVEALKREIAVLQGKVNTLEERLSRKDAAQPSAGVPARAMPDDEWDPFAEMQAMHDYMNSLMPFQAVMSPGHRGRGMFQNRFSFNPGYDIKGTDKSYVISFDMPGMEKSKIDVKVKDGVLMVSGERSSETEEKNAGNRMYRQERSFGYFARNIPLPEDAKAEGVEAKYDKGVLVVTVARKEAVNPKEPPVQKVEVK